MGNAVSIVQCYNGKSRYLDATRQHQTKVVAYSFVLSADLATRIAAEVPSG